MTTGPFTDVIYQPGTVARVILNRPEARNAQSWRLLAEMERAFTAAVEDDECRVIVLSGAGSSFSGGHDLDSADQVTEREAFDRQASEFMRAERYRDIYLDSHLRWRNLTKPTVAMVHGYCVFGGWIEQAYLSYQVLDNLTSLDADHQVVPWLATAWKQSADGLTWTFTLKKGVEFTDGTPLTAAAVAERLGISQKTVANTCTQIKDKLGADSTRALIRIAIDNGLAD